MGGGGKGGKLTKSPKCVISEIGGGKFIGSE